MNVTVPPFIGYGTSHIGCIEVTVPHHISAIHSVRVVLRNWPRDLFSGISDFQTIYLITWNG